MWCDGSVGLDLDEEVGVKRMWDFITCEEDLRHGEELTLKSHAMRQLRGSARLKKSTNARSMLPKV